MAMNINPQNLQLLESMIREDQTSISIPYKDYQLIVNEIYRLRMKKRSSNTETDGPSVNTIATRYILLQGEFKKLEDERTYYKQTSTNLMAALEKESKKNEGLQRDYEKLDQLYKAAKSEKLEMENNQLKIIQERDYAESVLLRKNVEFAEYQDELNKEMQSLKGEKIHFEIEKKKLNNQKLELKKLLRNIDTKDVKFTRKNTDISASHKSTMGFEVGDEFLEIGDDLLETKVNFVKSNSHKLHDTNEKTKIYGITAMQMDMHCKYIATAGSDEKIIISDVMKGFKEAGCFYTQGTVSNYLSFVENSGLLCSGTQAKDVEIYSLKKMKLAHRFKSHTDAVNVVEPFDDFRVVSGSQDRTIKIWDLKKNSLAASFIFPSAVLSLQTSSQSIVSGHFDGKMRISSLSTKKTIFEQDIFKDGEIKFMKILPNDVILLAGKNRHFKIFDLRRMDVIKSFNLDDQNIVDLKRVSYGIDVNYSKLLAGTHSGEFKMFDISDNIPEKKCDIKLSENGASMPFTLFSEFLDTGYVADFDGYVHVVDLKASL